MLPLIDRIVEWIRQSVLQAGCLGAVGGVSGGVDSAVVAALCHRTGLFARYLFLDCGSDPADRQAAELTARVVGFELEYIDLTPVFDELVSRLGPAGRMASANLKPRLRMTALYYTANRDRLLVVGTSNLPERMVGYFTKWGDGAADILPLGNFAKREVVQLAHALGIPPEIADRPPSAGLFPGQTDEGEMGITYRELDAYFRSEPVTPQTRARIERMIAASGHKRATAPIFAGPDGGDNGERTLQVGEHQTEESKS